MANFSLSIQMIPEADIHHHHRTWHLHQLFYTSLRLRYTLSPPHSGARNIRADYYILHSEGAHILDESHILILSRCPLHLDSREHRDLYSSLDISESGDSLASCLIGEDTRMVPPHDHQLRPRITHTSTTSQEITYAKTLYIHPPML